MNDLEIKNASKIDGLGNNSYQGNLYIKDGKIVAITHEETLEAKDSINANRKIVYVIVFCHLYRTWSSVMR